MDEKLFRADRPAKLNVQTLVNTAAGLVKETDRHQNGQQILWWESRKVPGLPAEPQLPPEWIGAASVSYFVGDGRAYYADLRRTMLDRATNSVHAMQVARQLAGTTKTRARSGAGRPRLHFQNIREAGPAFYDLPLNELSAADHHTGGWLRATWRTAPFYIIRCFPRLGSSPSL